VLVGDRKRQYGKMKMHEQSAPAPAVEGTRVDGKTMRSRRQRPAVKVHKL
jgi:hypothetical protein